MGERGSLERALEERRQDGLHAVRLVLGERAVELLERVLRESSHDDCRNAALRAERSACAAATSPARIQNRSIIFKDRRGVLSGYALETRQWQNRKISVSEIAARITRFLRRNL